MFNIIDCEQGSQEWFSARIGMFTGSTASDLHMGKTTSNRTILELKQENPQSYNLALTHLIAPYWN